MVRFKAGFSFLMFFFISMETLKRKLSLRITYALASSKGLKEQNTTVILLVVAVVVVVVLTIMSM